MQENQQQTNPKAKTTPEFTRKYKMLNPAQKRALLCKKQAANGFLLL